MSDDLVWLEGRLVRRDSLTTAELAHAVSMEESKRRSDEWLRSWREHDERVASMNRAERRFYKITRAEVLEARARLAAGEWLDEIEAMPDGPEKQAAALEWLEAEAEEVSGSGAGIEQGARE